MTPRQPIIQGLVFSAIFFVIVLLAEALLIVAIGMLFNSRLVPRGIGWFVLPFLGAFAGWAFGQQVGFEGLRTKIRIGSIKFSDKRFRVLIAGAVLWAVAVCAVFLIFDPFRRYRWGETEWFKFLFILAGPPIMGLLGMHLFDWALKDRTANPSSAIFQSDSRYAPSDAAYNNILWGLIAISVVDRKIDDDKIRWIEMFHEQMHKSALGRASIVTMAETFKIEGSKKIKAILYKNRDEMSVKDREMLIKGCCSISSVNGPISTKEREMILELAEIMGITEKRLAEL